VQGAQSGVSDDLLGWICPARPEIRQVRVTTLIELPRTAIVNLNALLAAFILARRELGHEWTSGPAGHLKLR